MGRKNTIYIPYKRSKCTEKKCQYIQAGKCIFTIKQAKYVFDTWDITTCESGLDEVHTPYSYDIGIFVKRVYLGTSNIR